MKKTLFLLLLFYFQNSNAQSLIDSLSNLRFSLEDTVGEQLAELAMNNPSLKVIDRQIDAGRYEWGIQKAGWLNNFNASFNLNEGNLQSSSAAENIGFYPRYNFNLTVPLGSFFTKGKQSKKAKAQYQEVQALKEVEEGKLKEAVLITYQNYQMNRYLLALQEAAIQDEKTIYNQVEQNFTINKITLEAFTIASKRLNDALAKRVTLMRDVNVTKYQLENLIGMPLENALELIKNKATE